MVFDKMVAIFYLNPHCIQERLQTKLGKPNTIPLPYVLEGQKVHGPFFNGLDQPTLRLAILISFLKIR